MSIHDEFEERKVFQRPFLALLVGRAYVPLLVVGTGVACFFLGRLSAMEQAIGVSISGPALVGAQSDLQSGQSSILKEAELDEMVIASKQGSVYYFPWCTQARRIKPENKVTFSSQKEARAAGYTPSTACVGTRQ